MVGTALQFMYNSSDHLLEIVLILPTIIHSMRWKGRLLIMIQLYCIKFWNIKSDQIRFLSLFPLFYFDITSDDINVYIYIYIHCCVLVLMQFCLYVNIKVFLKLTSIIYFWNILQTKKQEKSFKKSIQNKMLKILIIWWENSEIWMHPMTIGLTSDRGISDLTDQQL